MSNKGANELLENVKKKSEKHLMHANKQWQLYIENF
jgi:hypothetical protein